MIDHKKTTDCICTKQGCWRGGYPQKFPDYCAANRYEDEISAAGEEYQKPENRSIYKAACVTGAVNDGFRPRIQEAIHFTQIMEISSVGLAVCGAFEQEVKLIKELFGLNNITAVTANCPIGNMSAAQRHMPELDQYVNSACNPIAQATILNKENTQLNFIIGLCMGHDILFTKYSNAPVSTLIVKDRMLGNNPAAALYGHHAKRNLFGISRMDSKKV